MLLIFHCHSLSVTSKHQLVVNMHSHWKRLQTGLPAWFREALNLEAPTFTTSYCLDWKILGILGRQTSEAHFVSLGPHHRAYPILSPCGSTQGPGNRIDPKGSTKSNQPKGITSNPAHLVLFHHRGLESGLSLATLAAGKNDQHGTSDWLYARPPQ